MFRNILFEVLSLQNHHIILKDLHKSNLFCTFAG